MNGSRRAVFFDLQGTLGGEGHGDIMAFSFHPMAPRAIRLVNDGQFLAVVVTNQSHIAKGLFTMQDFERKMAGLMETREATLEDVADLSRLNAEVQSLHVGIEPEVFHDVRTSRVLQTCQTRKRRRSRYLASNGRAGSAERAGLMRTGMGMEVPSLNERYKEMCAEYGCLIEPVGASSTREVVEYLTELGCSVDSIKDQWQWVSRVQLEKAISFLRGRAYSFTNVASDPVHSLAVAQIESEMRERHGSLVAEVSVPNQIYLAVATRPGMPWAMRTHPTRRWNTMPRHRATGPQRAPNGKE